VTVHVAVELDVREDGEQANVDGAGVGKAAAVRLIGDVAEDPLSDAVTVADWLEEMVAAAKEKVAEDAEAGTVTVAGALRIGLFSEIVTETLLVTTADRATVHVEVLPEVIVAGVHASEETVGEGAAGAP